MLAADRFTQSQSDSAEALQWGQTSSRLDPRSQRPLNPDWDILQAGNLRCRQGQTIEERLSCPIAIVDFTTADRPLWEIFDCDSRQLFVIRPQQDKLSIKDLSGLEYIGLLGGARTFLLLTDAASNLVPPPGYARLIWHIDPEYCGRERQQEQLRSTLQTLNSSPCLASLFLSAQVQILTATYDSAKICVELTDPLPEITPVL